MRDSFRDGGPALVPKTDPRSCTQGSHEENEPAAAHGLQHGLKLEMELTLAPSPPQALHQCGPWTFAMGGEGLGTLILQQPLPPWSLPRRLTLA